MLYGTVAQAKAIEFPVLVYAEGGDEREFLCGFTYKANGDFSAPDILISAKHLVLHSSWDMTSCMPRTLAKGLFRSWYITPGSLHLAVA